MKTPLLKNLKLWILAGITGLSFLSSMTVSGNEDYYPCYKGYDYLDRKGMYMCTGIYRKML